MGLGLVERTKTKITPNEWARECIALARPTEEVKKCLVSAESANEGNFGFGRLWFKTKCTQNHSNIDFHKDRFHFFFEMTGMKGVPSVRGGTLMVQ